MDEKDLQILEEDSKQHPLCHYSQSFSKSQSNVNGKYVSEVIKHIQRHCPGERPVDVISSKTVSDSKQKELDDDFPSFFGGMLGGFGGNSHGGNGMFGGGFGERDHEFNPFSIIEKFMRSQESDSRGLKSSPWEFKKPWDFGNNTEDDLGTRSNNKSSSNNKFKGGVISGPVEEI